MENSRSDEMIKYVERYYRESDYYLAQNNAKGEELDFLHAIINDLTKQFFPQTATWGLRFFEELFDLQSQPGKSLEKRRSNVMKECMNDLQVTPLSMENLVKTILGNKIEIIRNVEPYTFKIKLDNLSNVSEILKLIEDYKEAHMRCKFDYKLHESSLIYIGAGIKYEDIITIRQVNESGV